MAHGYSRHTMDLDLLVRKADREMWIKALAALGYESFHSHENFEQFRSKNQDIDLDLMFVGNATFEGMFGASKKTSLGPVEARIPSLPHLIALKLHVLRQGLAHRVLGDLDDVIQLVLVNAIDLDQAEWRELFEKYGSQELYEKARFASRSD